MSVRPWPRLPAPDVGGCRPPSRMNTGRGSVSVKLSAGAGVHETFANGPEGGLGARAEAELAQDVRDVRSGRSLADPQHVGDLLVRLARAHESEDLELT